MITSKDKTYNQEWKDFIDQLKEDHLEEVKKKQEEQKKYAEIYNKLKKAGY